MTNKELISRLQSRIAKRKKIIAFFLTQHEKVYNKRIAQEQKEDKLIMKALLKAERVNKRYKELKFGMLKGDNYTESMRLSGMVDKES